MAMAQSIPAAIQYLQARIVTPEGALREMEAIGETVNLFELFRQFFPRDFARHGAVRFGDREGRRQAIKRFLELIDIRLFPVDQMFLDCWEDEEMGPFPIPVSPIFPDYWNDDLDGYSPFIQVIMLLAEFVGVVNVGDGPHSMALKEAREAAGRINWDKFKTLCAKARGPLRYLPDAVSIVTHDSDICWIAWNSENVGQEWFDWEERNIRWLAGEYKKTRAVAAKVDRLIGWAERDLANLLQVIRLWKRCRVEAQRVRVHA